MRGMIRRTAAFGYGANDTPGGRFYPLRLYPALSPKCAGALSEIYPTGALSEM